MAGVKLFRMAINGFNKADVLAYIEELNNNMREMEKNYKKRILELESQSPDDVDLNKADEEILSASIELENKITSLEKERDELYNKINELEQKAIMSPIQGANTDDVAQVRAEYEGRLSQLLTGFEQLMSEKREEYEKLLTEQQAACDEKIKEIIAENKNNLKRANEFAAPPQIVTPAPENSVGEIDYIKNIDDNVKFDIEKVRQSADNDAIIKEYEELKAEIISVKEELKSAKELSEYMETKSNDLEVKLNQSQNGVISLVNTVTEYENKIKEYEGQIENLKAQSVNIPVAAPDIGGLANSNELKSRITELENQIADDKQKIILLTDKAKLYEEIKSHVSQIISDARNDADKILISAQEKAKKMRTAVNESISIARERMKIMRQRVNESSESLVTATSKMADMFEMIIDSIELTDNQLINLMDDGQNPAYSTDDKQDEVLDRYKEKYNN